MLANFNLEATFLSSRLLDINSAMLNIFKLATFIPFRALFPYYLCAVVFGNKLHLSDGQITARDAVTRAVFPQTTDSSFGFQLTRWYYIARSRLLPFVRTKDMD
jgi:hypothetical protein